jgi:tRNA(Ile)-lysidine synthase
MLQVQNEVRDMIVRYHMISRGDRVIVGVSGGADSTALLHVLVQLNSVLRAHFRVVHVHHGLRGEEADRDAKTVQAICRSYKINCRVVEVQAEQFAKKHHISVEEAGRYLRYQIFEEEAEKWEKEEDTQKPVKIAVAHNKEDNAETIIMQLSRGSGLKGVAGMKPVRGRIIRPMLGVTRNEIEAYLTKEEIGWCTDSSNLHDDYTRNRIRHDILPKLISDVNHGAVDNITRAGRLIGEADIYLAKQAEAILKKCMVMDDESAGIPTAELDRQDPIIRSYMIRLLIGIVNRTMKNITAKHIEDIDKLADDITGKKIDLPYSLEAVKTYDMIWVGRTGFSGESGNQEADAAAEAEQNERYRKQFSFDVFPYDASMKIPAGNGVKWFDYDKIDHVMEIRTRRTGDYIVLKDGGRKTVKAYMADAKIPAAMRNRIPVLSIGSHVMWIVGYRISETWKVDDTTKRIFEVRYEGA